MLIILLPGLFVGFIVTWLCVSSVRPRHELGALVGRALVLGGIITLATQLLPPLLPVDVSVLYPELKWDSAYADAAGFPAAQWVSVRETFLRINGSSLPVRKMLLWGGLCFNLVFYALPMFWWLCCLRMPSKAGWHDHETP